LLKDTETILNLENECLEEIEKGLELRRKRRMTERKLRYEHLLDFKGPECRVCGIELTKTNWYPSRRAAQEKICKECFKRQRRERYARRKKELQKKKLRR